MRWVVLLIVLAGCSTIDSEPVQEVGRIPEPVEPAVPGATFSFLWAPTLDAEQVATPGAFSVTFKDVAQTHDEWEVPTDAYVFEITSAAPTSQPRDWLFRAQDMRWLGQGLATDEGPARLHFQDVGTGPFPPLMQASLLTMLFTTAADDGTQIGAWNLTWAPPSQDVPDLACEAMDIAATPTPRYAPQITVCMDDSLVPLWTVWSWPDGRVETAQRVEAGDPPVPTAEPVPRIDLPEPDAWLQAGLDDLWVPPMGNVFGAVEPAEAMAEAISIHPGYQMWRQEHPDAYMGDFVWFMETDPVGTDVSDIGTVLGNLFDGKDRLFFSAAGGKGPEDPAFVPINVQEHEFPYAAPAREQVDPLVSVAIMADYHDLWPEDPNIVHYVTQAPEPHDFSFPGRQHWNVLECFEEPNPFVIVSSINGQLLWEGTSRHEPNGSCGWGWQILWPPAPGSGWGGIQADEMTI